MMEEGNTYILNDVTIRSFNGNKYISFSRGASLSTTGNNEEKEQSMENCEVIGVILLNIYHACLSCEQKVTSLRLRATVCS